MAFSHVRMKGGEVSRRLCMESQHREEVKAASWMTRACHPWRNTPTSTPLTSRWRKRGCVFPQSSCLECNGGMEWHALPAMSERLVQRVIAQEDLHSARHSGGVF